MLWREERGQIDVWWNEEVQENIQRRREAKEKWDSRGDE